MKKLSRETKIEIFNLVNQGYSYSQVAQHLNIGKTAVHNNYKKMQQESLMQYFKNEDSIKLEINPIIAIDKELDANNESKTTPLENTTKETKISDKYTGVIPELMKLLPETFKGFVISEKEDCLIDFAIIISSYFSKTNQDVIILTFDLNRYSIRIINYESKKVVIRGSDNINHLINTIERAENEIIIFDNMDKMKITYEEWLDIIKSYPNVSVIALSNSIMENINNVDFIAKINFNKKNETIIETKYGYLKDFYYFSESAYFSLK